MTTASNQPKPASQSTIQANTAAQARFNFADTADFDRARRGLLQQIANPYARPRDPDGQALADETIRELASLFVQLHATLLRAELVRGSKA